MYEDFKLDDFIKKHTLRAHTQVDPQAQGRDKRYTEHEINRRHSMALAGEIERRFAAKWEGDGFLVHYTTNVIVLTADELAKFIRESVMDQRIHMTAFDPRPGGL